MNSFPSRLSVKICSTSWVALEGVSVYQKVDVDQGTLGNSNLFDKGLLLLDGNWQDIQMYGTH